MHLRRICVVCMLVLVIGCSDSADNVFIGKWELTENKYNFTSNIEIVKNGDALLMIEEDQKYTAKIADDGTLQLSSSFGTVSFAYIKDTDTIAGNGKEYMRAK